MIVSIGYQCVTAMDPMPRFLFFARVKQWKDELNAANQTKKRFLKQYWHYGCQCQTQNLAHNCYFISQLHAIFLTKKVSSSAQLEGPINQFSRSILHYLLSYTFISRQHRRAEAEVGESVTGNHIPFIISVLITSYRNSIF